MNKIYILVYFLKRMEFKKIIIESFKDTLKQIKSDLKVGGKNEIKTN